MQRLIRPRAFPGALALMLAAGACLAQAEEAVVNRVDMTVVEQLIVETQLARTPGLAIGEAVCPREVAPEVGGEFDCTLDIEGGGFRYIVTITDVADRAVDYSVVPERPIVEIASVRSFVRGLLGAEWGDATYSCGEATVLSAEVGSVIPCEVSAASGAIRHIEVAVEDDDGSLSATEVVSPTSGG